MLSLPVMLFDECLSDRIISLSSLQPQEITDVLDFASSIFNDDEPLEKHDPGHTPDKTTRFFEQMRKHLILSACTVAKVEESGVIVGCRLVIDEDSKIDYSNTFTDQMMEIWESVRSPFRSKFCNKLQPGNWAHFVGLCVSQQYRNKV